MEGSVCSSMSSDCVAVKEEVLWEQVADPRGVSEAAALAGLYTDHQVKDELVIGPEVLQPPDAVFTADQTCVNCEPPRGCHRDHTYAKTTSPEVVVKEEAVEWLREAAREAPAGREVPADCVGPLERRAGREARRGTRRAPNSAHVGNQMRAKTDIDTGKGTFVCDICEQRFALKARLMEHVLIHIHSTEREESERGVASNASVTRPMEAACVKREPQWDSDDANYELDEEQELAPVVLKEELELGPVVLQPPDAVYAFQALQKKERPACGPQAVQRRTCSVVLEPMLVDMELGVCKIARQVYEFRSCPESDVSQSDEEINSSKKFESLAGLRNRELKKGQAKTNKSKVLLQKENEIRERKTIPNSNKSPFKCNQCSYTSSNRSHLKVHLRTHTGEKPLKCSHCSSMFARKSNLLAHLRTHTGEKLFKCNQCSATFTQRGYLLGHLRTHTGEKPFKCNHCSSVFTVKSNLLVHLRTHNGEKPFKCKHCSSMFTQKAHLLDHLRTHTGEKPFKCNHCSSMFAQKSTLQAHLRTHTGEKPFKCNNCNSMFTQKSNLQVHLRTHNGEKPFKCKHCSSMFTQKAHLLDHLRTHTGEKPFKCNHCSSMFAQKSSLQAHLRTHTGEKPFKCNHCSFSFTQRVQLQRHLTTHTGEKPFQCNDCSSMFTNKSTLQVHLRTHTGEKPFECNHCSSTFRHKCNLVRHVKSCSGAGAGRSGRGRPRR